MPADPAAAKSLFLELVAIDEPSARAARLRERCAADPELLARVSALLAANDRALMGEGTATFGPDSVGAPDAGTAYSAGKDEHDGAVLAGKYKLVEEIGEGGMGSVFIAQQTGPVKRAVAVKVIKAGMDSKAVLARFEVERQALALMDHPNIARVFDAGTTDSGRPFFVMELVKGVPITEFCDERKLTPRQRLELFVPVCQAIQHAHQKGVIHRDVKPSNVLVALYDGRPVPKVIDFGVAKAAGQSLTDKTLVTGIGAVVGTPEYMSPEQANLNNLDVDTRSDVYSLGVLLYELLTGTTPVDRKSLGKAALLEVLRIVREVEPPRPSAKLSTIDTLPSVAANRGTEPAKLSRLLRGELDWVVLKALEKDRSRRYETANALARDVQCYLADELVEARPPSAGYRLRKFVRRHKGPVLATSLVLMALLAGMAGTTGGLIEARRQERLARDEASAKEKARRAAEAARDREADERGYAEAIAHFVKDDFLALTSVEGQTRFDGGQLTRDATLRDLLDRAARKLKERRGLAPRTEAELSWMVGVSYRGIGEADRAIPFLERSVELHRRSAGWDEAATLNARNSLGAAYWAAGQYDRALQFGEEALQLRRAKLGPDHPDTLMSMNNLAVTYVGVGRRDQAVPLFEEALRLRKVNLGPDHRDTLLTMTNLAAAYHATGKRGLAVPLFKETLARQQATLGRDHPDTLRTMSLLAEAYRDAGELELALSLGEEALGLRKARLGPDHPDTLQSMSSLGSVHQAVGRWDRALPMFEEALGLRKARLGPDHPDTLKSMSSLADVYRAAGKPELALPLFEETLKLRKSKFGPCHPDTLVTMSSLAATYRAAGKPELALPLFEEALKLMKAELGPDHPDTLATKCNLAVAYAFTAKPELALPLCEEVLEVQRAKLGPNHPDTLRTMNNLAVAYAKAKQLDQAIPLFESAFKSQEAKFGRCHPDTLLTMANLGVMYNDTGRHAEAVPLLEEVYRAAKQYPELRRYASELPKAYAQTGQYLKLAAVLQEVLTEERKTLPKDSPRLAGGLAQFGLALLKQEKWAEAEPLLRECLAIRESTQPDEWTTFNTQSMLGGALLGQQKYADAEPLLLKGYEGMKQREKSIPQYGGGELRIPETLDRLIELYTATNKPDEAKKWQAERAKYPNVAPPPRAVMR